jgi:hypothetical protein
MWRFLIDCLEHFKVKKIKALKIGGETAVSADSQKSVNGHRYQKRVFLQDAFR